MAEQKTKIDWTDSQSLAIHAGRENLIVSAAAGSGKTAALTERIFTLLTDENDPIPLSEIVAITFTRAAARNLKKKLSERIARAQAEHPEDTHLYRLQMQLPYANISTVHSFCLRIVLENSELLGLPARLKLGEEATLDALKKRCMNEALNEFNRQDPTESAEKAHAHKTLTKTFSFGGKQPVTAPLAVYDRLRAAPEGVSKLYDLANEAEQNLNDVKNGALPFLNSAIGKLVREQILFTLRGMQKKLECYFECYPEDERSDEAILKAPLQLQEELTKLVAICEDDHADYDTIKRAIANATPAAQYKPKSPTIAKDSTPGKALEKLYQRIKKSLDHLKLVHSADIDTILLQEERRLIAMRAMHRLLVSFETRYEAKKQEKGILDYSDLEHYALKALQELQKSGAGTSYCRALFVDEYQDTNRLQDDFFRKCVAKDGFFFFVGDVKQSIYLFRNAAPELFLGYKNSFPQYQKEEKKDAGALGRSIFFSQNFRSDATIIDFANDVFQTLLNDQEHEKDRMYAENDRLKYAKKIKANRDLPVEYYLAESEKSSDGKRRDEYTLVIEKVRELIETEGRKPEEIAVIAYSNRVLSTLRTLMIQSGIDVAPGSPELLNRPEILHFTALLGAICDPFDDISLVALCTSPLFALSSAELKEIRTHASGSFFTALQIAGDKTLLSPISERAREVLDFLDLWQDYAKKHTPAETVLRLLRSTGIFEALAENDTRKRENLLALYELSQGFGKGSAKTLADFLTYLENGRNVESPSASDAQVRKGYVTLMTVHKSKGLEFPVCIYMSLSKKPIGEAQLYFDLNHGLFLRDYDPDKNTLAQTIPYRATKHLRGVERLEEEKRLLYVGITRAVEKLILIDVLKSQQTISSLFTDAGLFPLLKDGAIHSHELSRPDQLLLYGLRDDPALIKFAEDSQKTDSALPRGEICCRNFILHVLDDGDLPPLSKATVKKENDPTKHSSHSARFSPHEEKELRRSLDAELERRNATLAPAKLSVSEILHLGKTPKNGKTHLSFSSDDRIGARHGTAMHAFMQFCDFTAAKVSPEDEAARLVDHAFLTKEQAEGLNFLALSRFFSSKTFANIEKSPRVKRELRFNVFLPAEKILPTGDGEILIQGVIDCFYEKEDGTYAILDFKTDAVNPKNGEDVLRDRHAKQLRLYALALKELTGKDVTELSLYSFCLSREIPIHLE